MTEPLRGLRYHRMSAGMTFTQVAKEIGLTVSHYSKIEHGTVQPKLYQLKALAKLFRIKLDDLL